MKRAYFALAAIGLLAGCAAQDHYYSHGVCVTCVNNPITGKPLNYDPNETPQQVVSTEGSGRQVSGQVSISELRGTITIDSPLDVDTAYARIKPAFGFRATSDFNLNDRNDKRAMDDVAWKYDATPGAYYNMSDYGRQTVNGIQYSIVQKVQIQKNGVGSRILYTFEPTSQAYDVNAMEVVVERRLKAALN